MRPQMLRWLTLFSVVCWWPVARGAVNHGFEQGSLAPWVLTGVGGIASNGVFQPPINPPNGHFMGYITTLNNEGCEDFGFFNESPDIDGNGIKETEYSSLSITFTTAVPSMVCVDLNLLTDEILSGDPAAVNDSDVFGVATGNVRTGPFLLLLAVAPTNGSYAGTARALPPASFSDELIVVQNYGGSQFKGQTGFSNYCFAVEPGVHTWEFFVADSHTDGVASAMLIDNFTVTPGSAAETVVQVSDLNPGAPGSYPSYLTHFKGEIYFRGNTGLQDTELWRFDGTRAQRVADINAGLAGSSPSYLTVFKDALYFDAYVNGIGTRLHRFDGTNVSRLTTVPSSFSGSGAWKPAIFNQRLYFWSGTKMYSFDGTNMAFLNTPPSPATDPIVFNGQLYYGAWNTTHGVELWRFDGNVQTRVTDINPGTGDAYPESLVVYGGSLYFRAQDADSGSELWRFNGSTATRAADIFPGSGSSFPGSFGIYRNLLFFQADDGVRGTELWQFDGTNAVLAADINVNPIYEEGGDRLSDSNPTALTVLNDLLYFAASDGTNGGLWRYDGTNSSLIGGGTWNSVNELLVFQNTLYFDDDDGVHGRELWKVDPFPARRMDIATSAGAVQLQLSEAETGRYIIEASSDAETWTPIYTNNAVNGTIRFTDPAASSSTVRFYRAVTD